MKNMPINMRNTERWSADVQKSVLFYNDWFLRFALKTVLDAVWHSLNEIPPETLVSSGRTYGGGLHKLEPRELMRAPANVEVFGSSGTLFQSSLF